MNFVWRGLVAVLGGEEFFFFEKLFLCWGFCIRWLVFYLKL